MEVNMTNTSKSFSAGQLRGASKTQEAPVVESLAGVETTKPNNGNRHARIYAYAKGTSALAKGMGGGYR